ncbi:unnamed protein product [Peniophora sp. CBMAI 1063]|nr:unnamed protein product [Peniophora sp. CBMAI 1063]
MSDGMQTPPHGTKQTVVELGPQRAKRADIMAELCALRQPQYPLDMRFILSSPRNAEFEPPLMHYGVALSKHELLRCVTQLGIAPAVFDLTGLTGRSKRSSYDATQSYSYEREAREKLLCYFYQQPEIRKLATRFEFRDCFVPDSQDAYVLSLYTNYSMEEKVWSSSRKREAVEGKVTEVLFRHLDGKPSFKWYWDMQACGFGYCAPWDEFNIWPISETPRWTRKIDHTHPSKGRLLRMPRSGRSRSFRSR